MGNEELSTARTLRVRWSQALAFKDKHHDQASAAIEQQAWNTLIDYIETHGLSRTDADPRVDYPPIEEPPAPDIQQLRRDCNHGLTHVEYPSPDPDDTTKVYICEECGQQLSGGRYLPAADPLQ